MWACVVLVFLARSVQGGQSLFNLGPVVSITLSMCVCSVWYCRRSRIRAAEAAGVVGDREGVGSEGGAETLSSRLLGDAWDVTRELDALAASYAEHHGRGGEAEETGGSDDALAGTNDAVPDTDTS